MFPFAIPAWGKYLALVVVIAAIYAKGSSDGQEHEQNRWLKQEAVAKEAARAREGALQAQVDAAGADLSAKQAEIERLQNKTRVETRNYYVTNPAANVQCLAPERLRSIEESDAAAKTAITAGQRAQ